MFIGPMKGMVAVGHFPDISVPVVRIVSLGGLALAVHTVVVWVEDTGSQSYLPQGDPILGLLLAIGFLVGGWGGVRGWLLGAVVRGCELRLRGWFLTRSIHVTLIDSWALRPSWRGEHLFVVMTDGKELAVPGAEGPVVHLRGRGIVPLQKAVAVLNEASVGRVPAGTPD